MTLNYVRYVDKWVGLAICLVLFCFDRVIGRFFGRHIPSLLATTPPPLDAEPHCPRRVLCIKFYGLGNTAMLIPVLEALRRRHPDAELDFLTDRKSTRLNSSHGYISYAVFCLKKKKKLQDPGHHRRARSHASSARTT